VIALSKVEIELEKERETKNTIRYAEIEGDKPPIIGTLYLQKFAVKRLEDPGKIRVTIEAA
jgi:hypothetical protein